MNKQEFSVGATSIIFSLTLAEIARQAAQMKLMRKLEKQALARAAKEARKQQGTFPSHRESEEKGRGGGFVGGGGARPVAAFDCCRSGGHFKTPLIKISQL